MKKLLSFLLLFTFSLGLSFSINSPAYALLPSVEEGVAGNTRSAEECKEFLEEIYDEIGEDEAQEYIENKDADQEQAEGVEYILACGIKSGYIKAWMIPYYAKYMLNFIIGLAGILSVLMIMIGGYFYIAGGISDDKEKGKTIIKYALLGLILTTLSWVIVNFIIILIT